MSDEFMNEIQEDVRREELIQLWKRYGHYFIMTVVVLVASAIATSYWNHYQHQQKISKAHAYEEALNLLDEKNDAEALKELQQIAANSDHHYSLLALFKQVAINDSDGLAALNRIQDNPRNDTSFRELASLYIIMHLINQEQFETALEKLSPLVNGNSSWRALAFELKGVILMHMDKYQEARDLFSILAQDESASDGIRMRAQAFLDLMQNAVVGEMK